MAQMIKHTCLCYGSEYNHFPLIALKHRIIHVHQTVTYIKLIMSKYVAVDVTIIENALKKYFKKQNKKTIIIGNAAIPCSFQAYT